MTIYITDRPVNSREFLLCVLEEFYGLHEPNLIIGLHGKPYIDGNPLYFNLSHGGNATALAVGTQNIGLDLEPRDNRPHEAIVRRLSPAERREDFLKVWTAKEAYVKYRGETLAALLPRLTFEKGALFFDGKQVPESLAFFERENYLLCLCTAMPQSVELRVI